MKKIAVVNQKGGVGKTTTSSALIHGLAKKGYRVLGIDMDSQQNLNSTFGIERNIGKTLYGVLIQEIEAKEAIRHLNDIDFIPASGNLAKADQEITQIGKEYRLQRALQPIEDQYDFCIIDCPPSLGVLTTNALVAVDTIIIPAQADVFSATGIMDLYETVQAVREYCRRDDLSIAGILLTRVNSRTKLTQEMTDLLEKIAAQIDTKVFQHTIRESIRIKEAQVSQESIFDYAPTEKVTDDYNKFIDEFLDHISE